MVFWQRVAFGAVISVIGLAAVSIPAIAGDLRIPLPKRSLTTPVQELNRDGVAAIQKHDIEKAKTLFYKAYLYDPNDPFTLNNLGYVAELEGQVERARRFYALAGQLATEAEVDRASVPRMEGKTFAEVVGSIGDVPMRVNRSNVESVRLLSQGRASEADAMLKENLVIDPRNPFTLNNMGVTKEMEGELEDAIKYYSAAADTHSAEPVIVTLAGRWRGKPVSEMAADSVKRVQQRLHEHETPEAQAVRMNLRGVAAVNRNDWTDARKFFLQAYDLNPQSPFSLNNAGFISEMDGDLETAEFFYDKARHSENADSKVGIATRRAAEGKKLFEVAVDNNQKVDNKITADRNVRSREIGPIELRRRDGTVVNDSEAPPEEPTQQTPGQGPTLGPPTPPIPQLSPETPAGPPAEPEPLPQDQTQPQAQPPGQPVPQ